MADEAVALEGVSRHFGSVAAVDGIDLAVRPGEMMTLLGPSGCGKTTTLNLIAGFLQPDRGVIRLAGRPVQNLPPFKRDIGLVFQDYALFPHMSVAENVGYGLRMRGIARPEIATRVAEALDLVRLPHHGGRRPNELSGGQRQRVALARALVIRPTVLLLDEPLSNLDLKLREEMRLEITTVQKRVGITTILVTHDQGEALVVSDRVAVMRQGRIEQLGAPAAIYERPRTRFVAEFIGQMNFVRGAVLGPGQGSGCVVEVAGQPIEVAAPTAPAPGAAVDVAFRPERVFLAEGEVGPDALALAGRVARHVYLGTRNELHVDVGAERPVVVELVNDGRIVPPAIGGPVMLAVAARECTAFPPETP